MDNPTEYEAAARHAASDLEHFERHGEMPGDWPTPHDGDGPVWVVKRMASSDFSPEQVRGLSMAEMSERWRAAKYHLSVPTGIASLDTVTAGGLPVGQMTTLLGYTGVGKSELSRQIRRYAAEHGTPVVHVDVELGHERIYERDISQRSDVPASLLHDDELLGEIQYGNIATAVDHLGGLPIRTICPGGGVPLPSLRMAVEKEVAAIGGDSPALVIFDSLQRLSAGALGESQRLQVQSFCRWAERLARDLSVAVLMTSEQKRDNEGKMPSPKDALTSGAESRAIEFTSDLVLAMVPGDIGDETIAPDAADGHERRVSILICKNRRGQIGYLREDLFFTGPCWGMRVGPRPDKYEDRVMEVLTKAKGKPLRKEDICRAVTGKREAVSKSVDRLADRKCIIWVVQPFPGFKIWEREELSPPMPDGNPFPTSGTRDIPTFGNGSTSRSLSSITPVTNPFPNEGTGGSHPRSQNPPPVKVGVGERVEAENQTAEISAGGEDDCPV